MHVPQATDTSAREVLPRPVGVVGGVVGVAAQCAVRVKVREQWPKVARERSSPANPTFQGGAPRQDERERDFTTSNCGQYTSAESIPTLKNRELIHFGFLF